MNKKRVQVEIDNIQIKMIEMNKQYNSNIENIKNEMNNMQNKITDPNLLNKLHEKSKTDTDNVNNRYHDMMKNFYNH